MTERKRSMLVGIPCEQPTWSDDDDIAPLPKKKRAKEAANKVALARLVVANEDTMSTDVHKLVEAGMSVVVVALNPDIRSVHHHVWYPCEVDCTNSDTTPLDVQEDRKTGEWECSADEMHGVAFLVERLCSSFNDSTTFAAVVTSQNAGDAARLVASSVLAAMRKESAERALLVAGPLPPPGCATMRAVVARYRKWSKLVVRGNIREHAKC